MDQQKEIFFGNCRSITEFEKLDTIGEGTYGVVYSAIDKNTGQKVAIKKIKIHDKDNGFPITSLREIKSLQLFKGHPNIVELKDVVVGFKRNSIFLVFEYCEKDLANLCEQLFQNNITLQESIFYKKQGDIKCIVIQILNALKFLQQSKQMHRDLKLSNILISEGGIIKLADFGLSRNFYIKYTENVVTLWYRAPEILLNYDQYNEKADVWSMGCIFAELLNKGFSLFPGKNEIQQFKIICQTIGYPDQKIENLILQNNPKDIQEEFKKLRINKKNYLKTKFPKLSENGLDLLDQMLQWDQNKRICIDKCLIHPYFYENPKPTQPKDIKFKFKEDFFQNKKIKF